MVYAIGELASGALAADRARRAWSEYEAKALVARARAQAGEIGTTATPMRGAPVARLRVPRLGLDEIVLEGVGDRELNAGPGHLPGSALPGTAGNAVISAHRDRHFRTLDRIQLGDTIVTETMQWSGSWVVVARQVVGRNTPALFASAEPKLTLTTCWPIQYFGSAPDRLIISARPVSGTWIAGLPRPTSGGI
jgi:sortase A